MSPFARIGRIWLASFPRCGYCPSPFRADRVRAHILFLVTLVTTQAGVHRSLCSFAVRAFDGRSDAGTRFGGNWHPSTAWSAALHFSVLVWSPLSRLWDDNVVGTFCTRSMAIRMAYQCRGNDFGVHQCGRCALVIDVGGTRKMARGETGRLGTVAVLFFHSHDHIGTLADSNHAAHREMTAL